MSHTDWQRSFEEYRRDRTARRLQDGQAHRPLGPNADVLQELEAAERRELLNARLTREVQDFFEDATRTVATLVKQVTAEEEQSCAERIRSEMEDFLEDVIRRAESFMQALRVDEDPRAEAHLEPRLGNLVGRPLDAFRHEGTAELADKHIGQDPFKTSPSALHDERVERAEQALAQDAEEDTPSFAAAPSEGRDEVDRPAAPSAPPLDPGKFEEDVELQDHLVACVQVEEPSLARVESASAGDSDAMPRPAPTADLPLLSKLAEDPAKLARALDLLVDSGLLTAEDAAAVGARLSR